MTSGLVRELRLMRDGIISDHVTLGRVETRVPRTASISSGELCLMSVS